MDFLYSFFVFYLPLLFSLSVHEWAHAFMAKKKGDDHAEQMGRLTLNPIPHIDPVGTVFLPLAAIFTGLPVFGWAKPVPVLESNLKNPKEDLFWIALAGPLSNFIMAFTAGAVIFIFYLIPEYSKELTRLSYAFIYINLLLGFFNLIPLHPLDGAKVLARFLPLKWNLFLESIQVYSSFLLISIFIFGGFRYLVFPAFVLTEFLTSWPEFLF